MGREQSKDLIIKRISKRKKRVSIHSFFYLKNNLFFKIIYVLVIIQVHP